ncbi:MAG: GNAT family N-acetyltransferase [Acetobacteraceae bacterium]
MIPAHPSHAAALAAIHAASFPAASAWDAASFAAQLALPGVFGLIHPEGALVVGRVAADEAEILTLAVIPSARRRGLGAALVRAAMLAAGAEGAATMFLEVAASNNAGRALYAAVGFRSVGRRRRYYPDGGDAMVLEATIKPLTRD